MSFQQPDSKPQVIATIAGMKIDGSKEFSFKQGDLSHRITSFNGHLTVQATVVEAATLETQVGLDMINIWKGATSPNFSVFSALSSRTWRNRPVLI